MLVSTVTGRSPVVGVGGSGWIAKNCKEVQGNSGMIEMFLFFIVVIV